MMFKNPGIDKKYIIFLLLIINVLLITGCTESESINLDQQVESEQLELPDDSTEAETIISAVAKDANDLTGTYEDDSMALKLILIQKDGFITYNFCGLDGSDPFIETDCKIESTYIAGQYYYITKNMNGTLAISSGVGEPWGNFVRVDDKAVIDLSEMNSNISDEDYISESTDATNENNLLPPAYDFRCATGVLTEGTYSYMEDDGSYYDEVVLKAWYDEYGVPKADGFPEKLNLVFYKNDLIIANIEDLRFIDGDLCTYESILRDPFAGNDMDPLIYAVLIENLQKYEDGIYIGIEYTSKECVVVTGNFSGILNGDSVLMFGTLTDLTLGDEPIFYGMYMEILNDIF